MFSSSDTSTPPTPLAHSSLAIGQRQLIAKKMPAIPPEQIITGLNNKFNIVRDKACFIYIFTYIYMCIYIFFLVFIYFLTPLVKAGSALNRPLLTVDFLFMRFMLFNESVGRRAAPPPARPVCASITMSMSWPCRIFMPYALTLSFVVHPHTRSHTHTLTPFDLPCLQL